MASSSPKVMSILFLFALFSLQQIHGREFFSKIPSVNNEETQKTSSLPYKEEQITVGKQEPSFIPETENGYGLYGHESTRLPPTTTSTTEETYKPYVTPVRYHPDEPYNSIPESSINNKIDSYETEQKNLGEAASFTERGWSTEEENNNNNNINGEKQGMSDTRYMENGRYYYDVKNENVNYNPNQYNDRGFASNYNNNMGRRYNQQNQEEFQENEEDFDP